MSETKDEIAAERDQLRAENENLRGQLAASGVRRPAPVSHEFMLSEGQRQELLTNGVTTIGGVRTTREDIERRLSTRQADVELGDAEPVDGGVGVRVQGNTPGVDFVYPSVYAGAIDPAVAGTPGISGPAAYTDEAPPAPDTVPAPAPVRASE